MGARVAWSAALGESLVARVAAGESVRGICRQPGSPGLRTVVGWIAKKKTFGDAMRAAREAAGSPLTGRASTYCAETAEVIFARLAGGEGLVAICRDPSLPAVSTVMKWRRENAEFDAAMNMARDIAAETLFQAGAEICAEVTPKTARACEVRLRHLRWQAAKLAPRKYGSFRAVEARAEAETAGGGLTVMIKKFILDRDGGPGRWSDEPGEVVYTMTPRQLAGEFDGLPHPSAAAFKRREAERAARRAAGAAADGEGRRRPDEEAW